LDESNAEWEEHRLEWEGYGSERERPISPKKDIKIK
jgi:hypothetical protein